MSISLQEKMFCEMEQKEIFRQAQRYAFDYADNVKNSTAFQGKNTRRMNKMINVRHEE